MYTPRSGRDGFFIADDIEYPIYSWSINEFNERHPYYTAFSGGFPIRDSGVFPNSTVTIEGANNNRLIPLLFQSITGNLPFYIGWTDVPDAERDAIFVVGSLLDYRINIDYSNNGTPGMSWTAVFQIVYQPTKVTLSNINLLDSVQCYREPCLNYIFTTDLSLHAGLVKHVLAASIHFRWIKEGAITAASSRYPIMGRGIQDITMEYVVQGDFDYWFSKLPLRSDKHTYTHSFGTGPFDDYIVPNMKVSAIRDLVCDVRTGKISSATIMLEHSAI